MDIVEARAVVRIALTADGGCQYCSTALIGKLQAQFPEQDWRALTLETDPPDYVVRQLDEAIEDAAWDKQHADSAEG